MFFFSPVMNVFPPNLSFITWGFSFLRVQGIRWYIQFYDLFLLFFIRHLPDINVTLEAMLQPKVTSLPGHIQAVYVQNIAKLYAKILARQEEVCLQAVTSNKHFDVVAKLISRLHKCDGIRWTHWQL